MNPSEQHIEELISEREIETLMEGDIDAFLVRFEKGDFERAWKEKFDQAHEAFKNWELWNKPRPDPRPTPPQIIDE